MKKVIGLIIILILLVLPGFSQNFINNTVSTAIRSGTAVNETGIYDSVAIRVGTPYDTLRWYRGGVFKYYSLIRVGLPAIHIVTSTTVALRSVSTNTTATLQDEIILCDATSENITVTISPTAINRLTIQKVNSNFNTVTIQCSAGTIQGVSSYVLTGKWDTRTIVSDGINFFIVSQ